MDKFHRQHKEAPWKLHQNYTADMMNLRYGRIDDGVLTFQKEREEAEAPVLQAAE